MDDIRGKVDAVYREESRRVLATLIRLLGDFDLAEEALHEAFRAAIEQWPREGVPANPRAWLVSTGRFKGIDRIRVRNRMSPLAAEVAERLPAETEGVERDHSWPQLCPCQLNDCQMRAIESFSERSL
jgi:RNA polymerase sigma-70 factor (ECF subfamily)